MNKRATTEIAVDIVLALLLMAYIASLNPSTFSWLSTQYKWLRWHIWNFANPEWLKEALIVRGKL